MAARLKTKLVTIPVGGEISMATILNNPLDKYISSVTVRAHKSNVGDITWRDASGGEDGGYLEAREATSIDLAGKFLSYDALFFAGTAGDRFYMTVIG